LLLEICLLVPIGAVAAVGYGSALCRFFDIDPNPGDRGILGLLAFALIGCILHFAVALSTPVQITVLAGGLILAFAFRRDIRTSPGLNLLASAGLCLFVLLHPQAVHNYDDGLYYLQTFKWTREWPITVGLANLYGRLAFNSTLFVIAPLTDRVEIGWVTNYLAVAFVILSLFTRLVRLQGTSNFSAQVQYWLIAATILSTFVLNPPFLSWLGLLTSDSLVALLVLYWVALAAGLPYSAQGRADFALLLTSAALATTLKLSSAPLLVLTMALAWLVRRNEGVRQDENHHCSRAFGLSIALLALWIGRGVLLSGCVVYPIPQTCISELPWTVSPQQVEREQVVIRAWARRPVEPVSGEVLQNPSWLPMWFHSIRANASILLLPVGLLLGVFAFAKLASKLKPTDRNRLAVIAGGLISCLLLWFFEAPALRFGEGFILATALLGISLAAAALPIPVTAHHYAFQALIALMLLSCVFNMLLLRESSFVYTPPEAAVYQLPSPRGVAVSVPQTGDQCWAHALPCTPYVNPAALDRVHWPPDLRPAYHRKLQPPPGWRPLRFPGDSAIPARAVSNQASDH
jgi:hypothetical protein